MTFLQGSGNGSIHMRDKSAKEKLEFFGTSFFILVFFLVIGFLIDPVAFFQSITTNFPLMSAVILALLVGKWIAAQIGGRTFGYSPAARMTMWSLTLPPLAATLIAYDMFNPAGQRLIDSRLLNVVLPQVLTTSILGPVLTEHSRRACSKPRRIG
jgi:Kef-type K+ transport system membrane component KefB